MAAFPVDHGATAPTKGKGGSSSLFSFRGKTKTSRRSGRTGFGLALAKRAHGLQAAISGRRDRGLEAAPTDDGMNRAGDRTDRGQG